jgi:hypothetical protein
MKIKNLIIFIWLVLAFFIFGANSNNFAFASKEPGPILNDALFPPDRTRSLGASGGPRGGEGAFLGRAPYGAGPYDTSEFMMGKVSVTVILPESNGAIDVQTENWDASREAKVLSEIQKAMDWWKEKGGRKANLSFTYHFYPGRIDPRARTSYEPINRPSYTSPSGQELWISEIMSKFGYSSSSYFEAGRRYLNDTISRDGADWGVIIFAVDSKNDIDGSFTDGKFSYAYYGGPFLVTTYDNASYGIDNMDAVIAHEFGHIFYALDQYYAAHLDCGAKAGYLNIENQNSEYNSRGGSCRTNRDSIMRGGVIPFINKSLDDYSAWQVGWKDSDNDGILDILDVPPQILSVQKRKGQNKVFTVEGLARVGLFPNKNPYNDSLHEYFNQTSRNITLNKISKVEYRIDGGSFLSASASDGRFDEPEENFNFVTQALAEGVHRIEIRTQDSSGNWSNIFQDFIIFGVPLILTGAGETGGPHVRFFDINGNAISGFFAYAENFRGGANVASGDVDGDGQEEIVTSPGKDGGPHIRIWKQDGRPKYPGFFAYASTFRGGVNVALGDLDGDGKKEIITGSGEGGGPHVRVFDARGNLKFTPGFFAYGREFRGGVRVAAADLDGDGKDEIITGPGKGGGPQVRVFSRFGEPKALQFFAFHPDFRGGIDVAGGDVDGDGKAEIVVSQAGGGEAWVKVYRYNNEKTILSNFRAYAQGLEFGTRVALGDVNLDKKDEILTAPGQGGGPQVRIFESSGRVIMPGFFAYDNAFRGGADAAVSNF